ncbi:MAG: RNA-binding cell elongation regulator Jag/EloR [Spirochaetia bacterium]|jgi:spoIIIJ-associated protein|nr:RNA-binding cell elongation regulator Jag/EloR [Spirochaetia bacterium]
MVYEFEGKTEREAIELAAAQLGLETDEFDVEILESLSGGLFKKGKVKIRVHTNSDTGPELGTGAAAGDSSAAGVQPSSREESRERKLLSDEERIPMDEFEEKIVAWTKAVVDAMGYPSTVSVLFREEKKLGLKVDTENTSMIIGKKGKNIDALQLLANVYAGKLGREDVKVILDSENYRIRREESLVRIAYDSAEQVRRTGRSVLLEPMNPFERRIVHTALNDIVDIETKSEGEGLYKQVRVMFRGRR